MSKNPYPETHILRKNYLWHPCSQMKDYETFKPLMVAKAYGSYIELSDGSKVIDAISSWWCKSLGHSHPRLKQAVTRQMDKFEHVILANTTNENIEELSRRLTQLHTSAGKVFYAGDGSCAVEAALKMSLHSRKIQGHSQRNKFISLANGYHGETTGALSVSDVGRFREPYRDMLFPTCFIDNIPYATGEDDPLWHDCSEHWNKIEAQLQPLADTATAIIFEPIVQGVAGMKIYSPAFLKRLSVWARKHQVHLIADEIMTGLGRTGKMLACEHARIETDFVCLGKGLTAGWLPMSAVLVSDEIYDLFYDDYEKGKAFLHSHTHSGNALGVAIALEVLNIMEQEELCQQATRLGGYMKTMMQDIANNTGRLTNVRSVGAIVAADLVTTNPKERLGYNAYQKAVKLGALLRPLGNTIYWLPPLNMAMETLVELKNITEQAVNGV